MFFYDFDELVCAVFSHGAEWSGHLFGLYADDDDVVDFSFKVGDKDGERYAMGADVHGADFFFWDDAYGSWWVVHFCCVDEDECVWFLLFDQCCVVLRGCAAVYDENVGFFFFHLVCDVGSEAVVSSVSVTDAHDKGRLHFTFLFLF